MISIFIPVLLYDRLLSQTNSPILLQKGQKGVVGKCIVQEGRKGYNVGVLVTSRELRLAKIKASPCVSFG
jgi:hypothetical protein